MFCMVWCGGLTHLCSEWVGLQPAVRSPSKPGAKMLSSAKCISITTILLLMLSFRYSDLWYHVLSMLGCSQGFDPQSQGQGQGPEITKPIPAQMVRLNVTTWEQSTNFVTATVLQATKLICIVPEITAISRTFSLNFMMTSICERESDIRALIVSLSVYWAKTLIRQVLMCVDGEHKMRLISFTILSNLSHSLHSG